jgi:PTS system beta-glucosides-specific IIC component
VGQTLIEFDREAIRKEDLQTVTMMIVTNTSEYLDVLAINQSGTIFEGEQLLTLVK